MVCLGRPYHFKLFKDCLPQILLGPFLNTLTHMELATNTQHTCSIYISARLRWFLKSSSEALSLTNCNKLFHIILLPNLNKFGPQYFNPVWERFQNCVNLKFVTGNILENMFEATSWSKPSESLNMAFFIFQIFE